MHLWLWQLHRRCMYKLKKRHTIWCMDVEDFITFSMVIALKQKLMIKYWLQYTWRSTTKDTVTTENSEAWCDPGVPTWMPLNTGRYTCKTICSIWQCTVWWSGTNDKHTCEHKCHAASPGILDEFKIETANDEMLQAVIQEISKGGKTQHCSPSYPHYKKWSISDLRRALEGDIDCGSHCYEKENIEMTTWRARGNDQTEKES